MKFVVVNSNAETISAFRNDFTEVSKTCGERAKLSCFEGTLAQYVDSLKNESSKKIGVVSPANSLSLMGAGFDRAIAENFTGSKDDYRVFESMIQEHTLARFNGFVPPQTAHVIDLEKVFADYGKNFSPDFKITHIVQTPTMAVPEKIDVSTVFYCMWNTLLAIHDKLDLVILPAIGSGYGGVPPQMVARTISGAFGLYYMDIGPFERGAAVLLFLKKDYKAFDDSVDIARIESIVSEWGSDELKDQDFPLFWKTFYRCLKSLN